MMLPRFGDFMLAEAKTRDQKLMIAKHSSFRQSLAALDSDLRQETGKKDVSNHPRYKAMMANIKKLEDKMRKEGIELPTFMTK